MRSESKAELTEHRQLLKVKLWKERKEGIGIIACAYCNSIIARANQSVMHHAIVRRGVAQGWALADRAKIDCEENCQLLHPGKCHERAHAEPQRMVAIQIRRYGRKRIQTWIDSLPFKVSYEWDRGITEEKEKDNV